MTFWLIVLAVAAALFGLAWWSSGRTKSIVGRANGQAEAARGRALGQAMIHREGQRGPRWWRHPLTSPDPAPRRRAR